MRRAQRRAEDRRVPLPVVATQESSDLRVHQTDAHGQLPAVVVASQRAGQHDLDEMARVLPNPPQAVLGPDSPGR